MKESEHMRKIILVLCIALALSALTACNEKESAAVPSTDVSGVLTSPVVTTAAQSTREVDSTEPPVTTAAETEKDPGPEPDKGQLLTGLVFVNYVDGTGFAGVMNHSENVFVKYPDANRSVLSYDEVIITYYEADYTEDKVTLSIPEIDPENDIVYDHTITSVVSLTHAGIIAPAKPVIYLYPEEDTVCSVRLDFDGELTCTYPEYGKDGWEGFTARPDGTLVFPDGKEYYCLYWEGENSPGACGFESGFCVRGCDTASFLEETLPLLGLNAREANEFIIYWLPLMQNNDYNLISFDSESYTESAKLMIDPCPDTLIRVFMTFTPLTSPAEIEPQTFVTPERSGFTVVEWGGSRLG